MLMAASSKATTLKSWLVLSNAATVVYHYYASLRLSDRLLILLYHLECLFPVFVHQRCVLHVWQQTRYGCIINIVIINTY